MQTLTEAGRETTERTKAYKRSLLFLGLAVTIFLIWTLSSLLLPIVFGALLAYVYIPVVNRFTRYGIPHMLGILMLVAILFSSLLVAFLFIQSQIPDREQQLELRVTALYKLNDRYQDIMKLTPELDGPGWLHNTIGFETDPAMDYVNSFIALNEDERELFSRAIENHTDSEIIRYDRLKKYQEANLGLPVYATGEILHETLSNEGFRFAGRSAGDPTESGSILLTLANSIVIWLLMPVFFMYFLISRGALVKQLVAAVPNIYFEMTLTSLRNVDKAIGHYLRGILLEMAAVFSCYLVVLMLLGFSTSASVLIALACALLNIVPVVGSASGIVLCIFYALIVEDVKSIMGFVNDDNIIMFTAIGAILVQLIDNVAFKPLILGNATDLHPIAVILVVLGGGMLFGFWGILFSVPVVVVLKVMFTTVHQRLKMYQIVRF